jgi:hypothetical protein
MEGPRTSREEESNNDNRLKEDARKFVELARYSLLPHI